MVAPAAARWPPALHARLHAGAPVLALSASADGDPHSTYACAVALDERRLRFAVDRGSATCANLRGNACAALVVVGTAGANLLLGGRARLLSERIEAAAPIALELWELEVTRSRDQSWPGVTTSELVYRWPPTQRAAMRRLERAVFAAMRQGGAERRGG